jgi:hypothetical protein
MGTNTEPAREYKNNVFVDYIKSKDKLIEVYNAVKGTNYPQDTKIEVNTLENVLYRFIQNDISFVIDGKLVVIFEHQSTINEAMPLRMLEYIAKIYEQRVKSDAYYRRNNIKLPRPEFIVFYNGKEKYDERKELKLSASYEDGGSGEGGGESNGAGVPQANLVLTVIVYNINPGMNEDLIGKCKALRDYTTLIAKVREYEDEGATLEKAVENAIKYCIANNIMVEYLEKHGSETMGILVHEYSFEDELRVAKEEVAEKSREEGREEGREENARRMKADNMDPALIAKYTGLSEADIERL